jgi:RHH-type transcriptional regulator, rel operon repressor / antitoxin RelB
MLTVRLSPKLEARLNKLAKRTGRPKAYYAKQAIAEFLDEQEDYLMRSHVWKTNCRPFPSARW